MADQTYSSNIDKIPRGKRIPTAQIGLFEPVVKKSLTQFNVRQLNKKHIFTQFMPAAVLPTEVQGLAKH